MQRFFTSCNFSGLSVASPKTCSGYIHIEYLKTLEREPKSGRIQLKKERKTMKKFVVFSVIASAMMISFPSYGQQNGYDNIDNWDKRACFGYYQRYLAYQAGRDFDHGGFNKNTTFVVGRLTNQKLWCTYSRAYDHAFARDTRYREATESCQSYPTLIRGTCSFWLSYQNN